MKICRGKKHPKRIHTHTHTSIIYSRHTATVRGNLLTTKVETESNKLEFRMKSFIIETRFDVYAVVFHCNCERKLEKWKKKHEYTHIKRSESGERENGRVSIIKKIQAHSL